MILSSFWLIFAMSSAEQPDPLEPASVFLKQSLQYTGLLLVGLNGTVQFLPHLSHTTSCISGVSLLDLPESLSLPNLPPDLPNLPSDLPPNLPDSPESLLNLPPPNLLGDLLSPFLLKSLILYEYSRLFINLCETLLKKVYIAVFLLILNMKPKINKFIYWTPRILSILFLLFLAMFSLDVFDAQYGFWGTVLGLFMHNIPVLILLIILIISWKHEIVGGIAFILAGLFYIALVGRAILIESPHPWFMLFWPVPIAGPAFLIGILFLVNWYKKKKKK